MTIPYELANTLNVAHFDANNIIVGKSFYFSDASPQAKQNPFRDSLIDYDDDAVAGQIEIVIGTPIGSEPHEPTFGSNVLRRLFDGSSQANLRSLELDAIDALRKWLGGRLDFISVTATVDDSGNGDVYLVIPFRIKTSGLEKRYIGNLTQMQKTAA
jgi:phage baseplate assembly protein W